MPLYRYASLAFLLVSSIAPALSLAALDGQPAAAPTHGVLAEPVTVVPRPATSDSPQAALGEKLFASNLLSRGNVRNCASCHDIATNGAERRRVSLSPAGDPLPRNSPTVFNSALSFRQGWEGDARTLQDQAAFALASPAFMDETWDDVLAKLRADDDMNDRFARVYGRPADEAAVLDALAAYEQTLLTPDSRFDRWLAGDAKALTPGEVEGYALFKSVGCVSCHQGVNFGGNLYQKAGIFQPLLDLPPKRMRVPSLRNVAVTAPYFDDGSAATLHDAVLRMAEAQLGRQLISGQIDSITAFLATLTGRYRGRPLEPAR